MSRVKKLTGVVLVLFITLVQGISQDIGVVAKLSPNSGCQLGSSLTVTVQVFNFGTTISSPFDISYQIDGNTPITETVNLGTFNSSSSYSHTFATNADLSFPATYVMKFYTSLAGDINNGNDTLTVNVVNDPTTVGGSLPVDFSVCALGNTGTLSLTGYTGSILDWEITTDGGSTWNSLSNNTDNQPYLNLSQTSGYRVVVKSGFCAQDYSSVVNITVDPESIGGNVSGPASICTPPNSASISLSGQQGNIIDWEISTDGGSTWSGLGDNSNPLSVTNLPQTSSFRAEVQSGSCASVYSDTLEVVVISNLNGGDLTPILDSVCASANSGTVNLSNQVGTIDHWESSTDLVAWNTISNTTTSYSFANLADTTYFRVIVAGCTTDTSTLAQINVNAVSNGGIIPSSLNACQGDDITNISSTGLVGNSFIWESSQDGVNWASIGNQSTVDILGIQTSQQIRIVSSNGACQADTSNVLSINVSSAPSYTSVLAPDSLCISLNIDSIVFYGVNSSVVDWIYSEDGGTSWNSLSITDTILNISPVVNTSYGVLVSSGTCPIDTFFNDVHVSQNSLAGTIPIDTTICLNTDSITVNNTGFLGSVYWYGAANSSGPYTSFGSGNGALVSTHDYPFVYAEVANEVCPPAYSDTLSIYFFSASYGVTGDTLVEQYASASFDAFGGQTYLWQSNSLISDVTNPSQTVVISNPIVFYVDITDTNSCTYTDSIYVNVLDEGLQIATIITPNNDGFNDTWVIKSPEKLGAISVTVTNPFGQIVYSNEDYQSDWKGDFKGNSLPTGAYYYIVEAENGETFYGTLNVLAND